MLNSLFKIKSKSKNGINVISSYPREYSYLKPVIDSLQKENIPISFYVKKSIIESNLVKLSKLDKLYELDSFDLHFYVRKVFYKIVRRTCWILFKPFISIPKINYIITNLMSLNFDNPFEYKTIVTITKHQFPWLLCSRNNYIITFPGSWDHYFKYYIGYYSDVYVGWSKKMCLHWKDRQGSNLFKIGFPYIFDYASDFKLRKSLEKDIIQVNQKEKTFKVLYPLSTCLEFGESIYRSELHLVKIIQKALLEFNVDFIVKAKPNSSKAEIDELLTMFKLPSIKEPLKHINNFSKEYNLERRSLLENIDSVINFGTTFAIDSAIALLPVMQLDLRNYINKEIFNLSTLQNKFQPLEDYLLEKEDLIYSVYNDNDIYNAIKEYIKDLNTGSSNSKPYKYSKYLRESLTDSDYLTSNIRNKRQSEIVDFIKKHANS